MSLVTKYNNFMMDCLDDIGYHIVFSKTSSRKSIEQNGLIGGEYSNLELLITSSFMDAHRTKNIPKNFYRTTAVYMYPSFDYIWTRAEAKEYINDLNTPKESFLELDPHKNNEDVYAINLQNLDWFIGSTGLSGFCLSSANLQDNNPKCPYNEKEQLIYTKDYWHNFYSKKEFLEYGEKVERSNTDWGLDEILVPIRITPDRLTYIGKYRYGYFYPNKNIMNFVKSGYFKSFAMFKKYFDK